MNDREKIQEKLMEEHPILEMVSFNELDLQEKLKDNTFLTLKYQDLYNMEKMLYEEMEEKMEALMGKRYDHFRFEQDKALTKTEIEKYYLPKDKYIKKMRQVMRDQMIRVEFFKMCVSGLKDMKWNMKTFSDNERMGL
jgi:hypothetical protein